MAFSHQSCNIPQHSQLPHPLAPLFTAYLSSSLSRPDQPTCQLVAPLPSIPCANIRTTLPCVLKPHTLALLLNISANCTPSTQATSHTTQETARDILNSLLDKFIWKLETEVIAGSGTPQSLLLSPRHALCIPYKVLSIPWCTKSGAHIVPLTIWLQSSVTAHQSLPSHPVSNTALTSRLIYSLLISPVILPHTFSNLEPIVQYTDVTSPLTPRRPSFINSLDEMRGHTTT